MGWKVGTSILGLASSAASSTPSDGSRPASNAGLVLYPQRTWQSTATGGQYLQQQFLGAKTPVAVFLGNVNFPTCNVKVSPDGSSLTTLATGISVPRDARPNRRQVWLDLTNANSMAYLRIEPTGTPDIDPLTGVTATHYEIGQMACLEAAGILTLADGFGPTIKYTRKQAVTRLSFLSGGQDVSEDGVPYLEWTLGNPTFVKGLVQADFLSILNVGEVLPLIFYENQGAPEHAYLVQRMDDPTIEDSIVTFNSTLTLREPA